MDFITLTVELIGFLILCVWTVIPIREFVQIARRMSLAKSTALAERESERAEVRS